MITRAYLTTRDDERRLRERGLRCRLSIRGGVVRVELVDVKSGRIVAVGQDADGATAFRRAMARPQVQARALPASGMGVKRSTQVLDEYAHRRAERLGLV